MTKNKEGFAYICKYYLRKFQNKYRYTYMEILVCSALKYTEYLRYCLRYILKYTVLKYTALEYNHN